MLGWWIVVTRSEAGDKAEALASWEVGLGGLRWLEDLEAEGRLTGLRSDGYPTRYAGRAGDVLPLLEAVTAAIDFTYKLYKPSFAADRIAACPADATVFVDAWDQS